MSKKNKAPGDFIGREFVLTREFDAPRALVFRMWTEPKHLAQWWGPCGFTNPVCEWDARPGGKIYDVMRAPNGAEFPMGGEFRELVAPERLVLTTGALGETGKLIFELLHEVTFAELQGKTMLTIRSRVTMTTPGAEKYLGGFETGMTLSLERLAEGLAEITAREIVSTRGFAAAPEAVFEVFADPARLARWWGPAGFATTIQEFDLRPGGTWRLTLRGPDGTEYHNEKTFTEVAPPACVAFDHRDPAHGFQMTMTFAEEAGGRTRLTWRMVFVHAAEATRVRAIITLANEQNFDRLAAHLAHSHPT